MRRLGAVLIALVAAAVFVGAAGAESGLTYETWTPITNTFYNPCNGEAVPMTGTFHQVVHNSGTPNTTVFVGIDSFHLTGVGTTTGTNYVSNQTANFQYTTVNNGVLELTSIDQVEVVSKGSAPNFMIIATSHLTINANGDITSDSTNFDTTCTG